ncbi:MAG: hypothetical protein HOP14_05200 [Acidobacteria bacterium]|nr:hypothetical protein [Acidobacteriota bacterium]
MGRTTALLIVCLAVAATGLQAGLDRVGRPGLPDGVTGNILYLRSPGVATRAALSYRSLAADVYWIRTLQHYGRTKLSDEARKPYDLLQPLLDLTTSLDPRFNVAYRFGAIFLAEDPPAGAGRPDQAIALLEKGLVAQPGKWEFAQDIGFVHYWWRHDFDSAARWFQRAADMPDAPNWLAPLAAVTLAQGGSRESARLLWQQVVAEADADWLVSQGEFRLRQLDALDQIAALETLTREYEARRGDPPASWEALVQSGALRGMPLDPDGFPYRLNPYWGTVSLDERSTLNPLPTDAGTRP